MNILQELITSGIICTPTPPTNFNNNTSIGVYFLVALVALFIVIIFMLCLKLHDKNKLIESLKEKSFPTIYTNNETKDIIVISNDNYIVISIKFLIYDENNNFVKEYIVQEYNLSKGEQRIIANTSEFSEYKIKCKIINCKEKV